jgi:hypothetical protein
MITIKEGTSYNEYLLLQIQSTLAGLSPTNAGLSPTNAGLSIKS